MEWSLFWTLIGQILIALVILTLPIAVSVLVIGQAAGASRGNRSRKIL